MTHKHHFRTFAETIHGYIGLCDGCGVINVAFNNSLFCLTFEQFEGFYEMVTDRAGMRPFGTTHGKEWLLHTPMPNYFLIFSDEELDHLKTLLDEATPVLEAQRILNRTRSDLTRTN